MLKFVGYCRHKQHFIPNFVARYGSISTWTFQIPKSYNSSVIATKVRAKGDGRTTAMLLSTSSSVAYFSNVSRFWLISHQDHLNEVQSIRHRPRHVVYIRCRRLGTRSVDGLKSRSVVQNVTVDGIAGTQTARLSHEPSFLLRGKSIRSDGMFTDPFQRDVSPLQQFLKDCRQNERTPIGKLCPCVSRSVSEILHRFRW